MKNKYITTTLPYVNDAPHIGFALEFVQADVLARIWRINGDEVFFNTGVDEHGQKVYDKAMKEGASIQEYVDRYAKEYKNLKGLLNINFDNFIRTTDEHHIRAAQEMWRMCLAKGDIYKKKYKGKYCVADEMFVKEIDLVDGKCPNHPNAELKELEEENYFFKLTNYQDKLLAYLNEEGRIVPEWRRKEAIAFVEAGLEDFSISREKARMNWGIPVPKDDEQVMYVWFDALTNYISTLGWPDDKDGNFKKFWADKENGETLQVAGKDQVRFQSIMWQGMLMSADVPVTDKIFYHGFITSGGKKMSKSEGNVISPQELVDRYGTDATRYLLLRHVHPLEDTDITWGRLDEWYEAGLVNGLGNLVARILTLSEKYLTEPVEKREPAVDMFNKLETFRFDMFLDSTWSLVQGVDKHITDEESFKVVKNNLEEGVRMIKKYVDGLEGLYSIALQLRPFMPETSKKIEEAILANKKPENLFPRLEK